MNDKEKVTIVSTVNGTVGIYLPDLRFRKEWTRKGMKVQVDKELLEDILYDPGSEYMFKTGMLYIEDMDVKKELGLEPEDATQPVNIIVLSDKDKERYLKNLPLHEFKEKVKELSVEQRRDLVDYAVEHEVISFDKNEVLEELVGLNPMKMIQLNRQNKEA
jgi:hypothetical protein